MEICNSGTAIGKLITDNNQSEVLLYENYVMIKK